MTFPQKQMDSVHQNVLIITGMHRSGTSLVASALEKFGLDIGSRLLGSGLGNAHGHFEDIDFFEFHSEIYVKNKLSNYLEEIPTTIVFDAEEQARAQALVSERQSKGIWGWKDPRTTLFLDFWTDLLPDARYLFVYRHPVEVVLSILRRCGPPDYEVVENIEKGFKAWNVYNRLILDYYKNHSDKCFLFNIHAATANFDEFARRITGKLCLPLPERNSRVDFYQDDLKKIPITPQIEKVFSDLLPDSAFLYNELELFSDLAEPKENSVTYGQFSDLWSGFNDLITHNIANNIWLNDLIMGFLSLLAPDVVNNALRNFRRGIELEKTALINHINDLNLQIHAKDDLIEELKKKLDQRVYIPDDMPGKALVGDKKKLEDFLITADELVAAGEIDAAIHTLAEGCVNYPFEAVPYQLLACLYSQQKNYSLAEDAINKALDLKPQESSFYNQLGTILALQGDLVQADIAYRMALKIAPDNQEASDNLAYIHGLMQ